MSKNKNRTSYTINTVNIPKGTLLQSFQKFIEKDDSVRNIMSFLSATNARYIGMCGIDREFSKEEKEELYEFYTYFVYNYDEKTKRARLENWPEDAFVFRLANSLYGEDCEKANEEFVKTLPKTVLNDAKDLTEKIFAIRKDKHFSGMTDNDVWGIDLPGSIPKEYLEETKNRIMGVFANVIGKSGMVAIRIYTGNSKPDQMFGIKGNGHSWEPISKEEVRAADIESMKNKKVSEILEYIELER